jgi:AraC-like DNA-binding protein
MPSYLFPPERAAELLESTDKPIADISYAVGFPDPSEVRKGAALPEYDSAQVRE